MRASKDYDEYLLKSLKKPKEAAAYLNAALQENDPNLFLTAYYNVARAHGLVALAGKAGIHRVSLRKMFSCRGNPRWKSLCKLLAASHLRLRVESAA